MNTSTRFSPTVFTALILEPLKYYFANYAPEDVRYDHDPKQSKIQIIAANDLNTETRGFLPRIIVDRGDYSISPVMGVSNNMTDQQRFSITKGLVRDQKGVFVSGVAGIGITTRNEGTTEKLTDIITHYLVWASQFICNERNFKTFGLPMNVTRPMMSQEDGVVFTVNISIPWTIEERWETNQDGVIIKAISQSLESIA